MSKYQTTLSPEDYKKVVDVLYKAYESGLTTEILSIKVVDNTKIIKK